ncbi:MAG TPA: ComEC/Rec2 family competence protein, partial [Tepidiformaceae bacterium]|nr:ComEC/Rec2 family competence protein [Tepidiformaceae bacterium]
MILPFLALAFLLGVVGVATWDAPAWIAGASLALAAPGVYAWRGKQAALLVLIAASFALVGGYRFAAWEHRPTPDLARYVGQSVRLEGRIASDPDPGRTTTRYRVDVDRVSTGSAWLETDGAVLATLSQYASLDYGATVTVEGELELPPRVDTFDYRGYLERQGIVASLLFPAVDVLSEPSPRDLQSRLARSRLALDDSLQRALPEPHASLAGGIAFGRDGNLPDALYDDFRASGLAHLVAVSGSNVMLVAAASFALLRPALGRKRAVWPVAFAVLAYLAIAGFSPSVLRAGLMAGVFLFGAAIGRPSSGLAALAAAVIALLLIAPSLALDLGFQLSASATAGLIAAGPWVRELLERALRRIPLGGAVPAWVTEVAALSLCASVATFPISWVAFGEVSLVGPIANIAVTPFLVFAFWSSIATALAGIVWEPAGWAYGLFAYYCLSGIIAAAELAASVP